MTTNEVILYFGDVRKLARALDTSTNAIYQWGDTPPLSRQYELEVKTNGELKAEVKHG